MRIVFFGTPEFAVPSLRALLRERYPVVGVVTQPDRPRGRSRNTLVAPPVKLEAARAGIPVLQPASPLGDVFLAGVRRLEPDLGIVVAYGHILRPAVLSLPRLGMVNVHASLLPRWRGAAPIQHAIAAGDRETGVSIMQMEAGLDSGPVLHRIATPIGIEETAGALAARLAELGATALVDALSLMSAGFAQPEVQDAGGATIAPKIDREAARLDWRRDATALSRQVRAFDPAPG
ncbi:MAG: methionyl-tRNA formyltransferase, partial [Gemmatimonadota bacterium]|nr:methionyl-tRNA formyltransferase [Gemmatimonadota bacterium]